MIGYLGEILKIRREGQEQEISFDFTAELTAEDQSRLIALNRRYWEDFQARPQFRLHIWKAWTSFLSTEVEEYIPKVLVSIRDQNDRDDLYLASQNWILSHLVWEFFRKAESDWNQRLYFLRKNINLVVEEEAFLALQFSSNGKKAREYYDELASAADLTIMDRSVLVEKLLFVKEHYPPPQEDTLFALTACLENSGLRLSELITADA